MESSTTIKRLRAAPNINIPTIECKREFDLPHKFPSKVSNNIVQKGQNVTNIGNNTVALKSFNHLKDKDSLLTANLKKLRLQSKDGKDLGEVKVKFLSQGNVLDAKTITFNKANLNYKINKSVKLSIVSPSNAGKLTTFMSLKNDVERSKVMVKPVTFNKRLSGINGQPETKDKSNKVQMQSMLSKVSKINQQKNDRMILLKENSPKVLDNIQTVGKSIPKYITVKKDKILFGNIKQNDNYVIKKQNSNKEEDKKDETTRNQSKMSMSEVQSLPINHWKLAESKFPIVKCEKLLGSKNNITINKITRSPVSTNNDKLKINSNVRNSTAERNVRSNRNSCNMKLNDKESNVNTTTNLINSVDKTVNVTAQNHEQNNITVMPKKNTIVKPDNLTLVPEHNKHVNNEHQNVPNDSHEKSNSCQNETTSNNSISHKNSIPEINTDATKAEETSIGSVSEQEKLSQHWNIITEALISVKDEKLRTKALKALADCGISIGRQVPIRSPEKLKTVHDSLVQTDVFGLLDYKNFILVKEEIPVLERINQTERSTIKPLTKSAVTQTQTTVNVNKHIDNIHLFPSLTPISTQDTLDLDNYFNEYFGTNADVNKVKTVLSTPHSLYKKVSTQLESDYQGMQHWDDNGMLNVHRAVVNNHLHELQRLLLVLKAAKIDIDVPTDDGMTCLELAIKYNSSEDIVNLLLKAGAKPVSSELLHESAVLLSSKCSSPLLQDLLKYVTDSKLLNQVDSSGFAALHYCAFNSNMEGVSALIEAGANVNLRDNRSGRTPFFHALENNNVLIAQKLLENGAIANIPNFSGQTVLALIDETKSVSIKAALKRIVI